MNPDAYTPVGIDKWFKFLTVKVKFTSATDNVMKFKQKLHNFKRRSAKTKVSSNINFQSKKIQRFFCKSNIIKFLFAPVDDYGPKGIVD